MIHMGNNGESNINAEPLEIQFALARLCYEAFTDHHFNMAGVQYVDRIAHVQAIILQQLFETH